VPVTGNEAFSHNACRKRNKTNKNMSASAVSSTSAYSVTLNKKTKDTRVGILFKKYHEGVKVADISKGGIALHSSLRVGDKILSIDGKEVTDMTAKQAASLLRSTLGQVEIVAESTNSSINKVGHSAESTPLLISTSTMNSDSTSTTTTTSAFEKKSWTWKDSFQDHCRVLVHLPLIFAAPLFLSPKDLETIHLSINSVNDCQFCGNLHGELGRMAGLENEALTSDEENLAHDVFADFGYTFAKNNGFGTEVRTKYDEIVAAHGGFAGLSAEGIGYFMLWASLTGNTIKSFLEGTLRGSTKPGSNVIFEIFFVLYYGPLVIISVLLSVILKIFPSGMPTFFHVVFSLFLATVSSFWIVPYGILSILMLPCITGTRSIMIAPAGGYLP
jgi:AhpD family alkylhydroperoxidase